MTDLRSARNTEPITSVKLAEFPEVTLASTGLNIEGELSFDRWQTLGEVLVFFEASAGWLLGEWAIYGEQHFGDNYVQAIAEGSGFSADTVRAAQWVAEHVPPERRRPELSYGHHKAVAALEPAEQDRWLEEAASSGLSTRELYDRSRGKPEPAATGPAEPEQGLEEALRAVLAGYVPTDQLDDVLGRLVRVLQSRGLLEAA